MSSQSSSIIVVSGLPRSGTSLMMQILEAAGLPLLTDQKRKPDKNNPKGYYEYERVKRLQKDASWLKQAQGKAVKIISHLLKYLPPKYHYQIIFMKRNLKEIIASQRKMLARAGKISHPQEDEKLILLFQKHLKEINSWLKKQPNIDYLEINYNLLIKNPLPQLKKLIRFLNLNTSPQKLTSTIDPSLYRQRSV